MDAVDRQWERAISAMAARAEKKFERGKQMTGEEITATALYMPEKFRIMVKLVDNPRDDEIQGYIHWLEETLIPDLRESGREETAKEFETCIAAMTELGGYS